MHSVHHWKCSIIGDEVSDAVQLVSYKWLQLNVQQVPNHQMWSVAFGLCWLLHLFAWIVRIFGYLLANFLCHPSLTLALLSSQSKCALAVKFNRVLIRIIIQLHDEAFIRGCHFSIYQRTFVTRFCEKLIWPNERMRHSTLLKVSLLANLAWNSKALTERSVCEEIANSTSCLLALRHC